MTEYVRMISVFSLSLSFLYLGFSFCTPYSRFSPLFLVYVCLSGCKMVERKAWKCMLFIPFFFFLFLFFFFSFSLSLFFQKISPLLISKYDYMCCFRPLCIPKDILYLFQLYFINLFLLGRNGSLIF